MIQGALSRAYFDLFYNTNTYITDIYSLLVFSLFLKPQTYNNLWNQVSTYSEHMCKLYT